MRARKSARSVNPWSFEVGETYAVAHDELPPLRLDVRDGFGLTPHHSPDLLRWEAR